MKHEQHALRWMQIVQKGCWSREDRDCHGHTWNFAHPEWKKRYGQSKESGPPVTFGCFIQWRPIILFVFLLLSFPSFLADFMQQRRHVARERWKTDRQTDREREREILHRGKDSRERVTDKTSREAIKRSRGKNRLSRAGDGERWGERDIFGGRKKKERKKERKEGRKVRERWTERRTHARTLDAT